MSKRSERRRCVIWLAAALAALAVPIPARAADGFEILEPASGAQVSTPVPQVVLRLPGGAPAASPIWLSLDGVPLARDCLMGMGVCHAFLLPRASAAGDLYTTALRPGLVRLPVGPAPGVRTIRPPAGIATLGTLPLGSHTLEASLYGGPRGEGQLVAQASTTFTLVPPLG